MTDFGQTGSLTSLLFLAAVLLFSLLVPRRLRVPLLVGASALYYGWGRPIDMLVVFELGVVTYLLGWRVHQRTTQGNDRSARIYLTLGVIAGVSTLVVFKYSPLLVRTLNGIVNRLTGMSPLPVPALVMPLGISFIVFGMIRFLVDMRDPEGPAPSPLRYALHVLFFPSVSNGPIKGYAEFSQEVDDAGRPSARDILEGIGRLIVGAGKKFVLADGLLPLTVMLSNPGGRSAAQLLIGIYAYTLMIYLDFSGYSDMAIGGARMLGYRLPENFDWPYLQRNISEFWNHWHMTLTRFITSYVFIPLGGSRSSALKTARNVMVAMLVSGLWHGASWHFALWGVYHGAGVVAHRWFAAAVAWLRARSPRVDAFAATGTGATGGRVVSTIATFNFVAFGWVLFVLPAHRSLSVYREVFGWVAGLAVHAPQTLVAWLPF